MSRTSEPSQTQDLLATPLGDLIGTLRGHIVEVRAVLTASAELAGALRVQLSAAEAEHAAARAELTRMEILLEDVAGRAPRDVRQVLQEALAGSPGGEQLPGCEAAAGSPGVVDGRLLISGARLREQAVRSALRRGQIGVAIHHAAWLSWLRTDGFEPAGKRPDAVFLTQLSRSPLVVRTSDAGFYEVDPEAARKLQERVRALHEQLVQLPPPGQMSMLGDTRLRRHELGGEIARTERQAEEAWRILALERPPGFSGDEDDGEIVVRAWLSKLDDAR